MIRCSFLIGVFCCTTVFALTEGKVPVDVELPNATTDAKRIEFGERIDVRIWDADALPKNSNFVNKVRYIRVPSFLLSKEENAVWQTLNCIVTLKYDDGILRKMTGIGKLPKDRKACLAKMAEVREVLIQVFEDEIPDIECLTDDEIKRIKEELCNWGGGRLVAKCASSARLKHSDGKVIRFRIAYYEGLSLDGELRPFELNLNMEIDK